MDIGKRVKVIAKVIAQDNFWNDRIGTVLEPCSTGWCVNMDGREICFEEGDLMELDDQNVNGHNDHYKKMGISPFDVVDTWPLEQRVGAYRFECLKYIMRMDVKEDRLKQAEKNATCALKLVETLKKG